jgi:alpha-L-rhamnosidase
MRFIFTLAVSIIVANVSVSNLLAGGIQAENLQCEHLTNPLGLDTAKPRLSWTLRATPDDQREQYQTAYQIIVASSEKLLSENKGDLWKSRKIHSERCAEIEYEGKPLASDQRCYWKVRVWGKEGTGSPWSKPSYWSMGVLDRQAWQGKWLRYVKPLERKDDGEKNCLTLSNSKWIWTADGDATKSVPAGMRYFRLALDLPQKTAVEKAEIILTVDDRFKLYINGNQAGQNRRGNDSWRDAQKYDITNLLTTGRNCVAVEADNISNSPSGVAAKIFITLKDGEKIVKTSDDSWLVSKNAASGWEQPDFDDSKWEKAQVVGPMGIAPWGEVAQGRPVDSWAQINASPIFRKAFEVEKPLAKATAHICGLGYYELRLNGKKVGDRVLDPKFTRFDKRVLYATYDVTDQLIQGKNALGVMLGNGYYNVHEKDEWIFEQAPWRDEPTLLFQLRLDYADGTNKTIVSDAAWKASTGPVVHDGIRNGEEYDAQLDKPGWDTPAYDDSAWAVPQIADGPKGVLRAQTSAPIRVMQTIVPIGVTEPKPGEFVFDLGQNIAGWAQLKVSGPAGTKITMRYSERLHKDGSLSPEPNDKFVYEGPFQTDRYSLKGQGEEVWEPRFTYHGFRYIEVTGFPGKPTIENLRGRVVHTSFTPAGSFECSNELLNKIQQMTLWSYRGNFVGIPTDCPHREKNGWTGDAIVTTELAMLNFHNIPGYEAWMNDCKDELQASGQLTGIIPTSGWGRGIGPTWDSVNILIPWYLYQYSGDTRVLADNYDAMKINMEYFTKRAKNHILDFGLGDWLFPKTATPTAVTSTYYYYVDALLLSKIARILGKPSEAQSYAELAEKIHKAFQENFCKPGGVVANNSQTALSCAIFQNLAAPEEKKAIVDNLVTNVKQNNDHLDVGFTGAKYLFRVLADNGHSDLAYRILMQTTPPSYGDWVARGATTLWEDWVGEESLNHFAFGDISAWFYQYLAGINLDPEQPAFKHIIIRPLPLGDLKWVKATHESIFGLIAVSWKRNEHTFTLDLTVPVNASATVYIPTSDSASITEGGKPAKEAPSVKFLRNEGDTAVFEIGSGNYSFASPSVKSSPEKQ